MRVSAVHGILRLAVVLGCDEHDPVRLAAAQVDGGQRGAGGVSQPGRDVVVVGGAVGLVVEASDRVVHHPLPAGKALADRGELLPGVRAVVEVDVGVGQRAGGHRSGRRGGAARRRVATAAAGRERDPYERDDDS